MNRMILVFFLLFFSASASNGEDWEGKKILVDKRDKVISACEKGILSKGYPYVKVKKYCKCSVDFMTELAIKYNKEQINNIADKRGKNFIENDALQKCKYHLE